MTQNKIYACLVSACLIIGTISAIIKCSTQPQYENKYYQVALINSMYHDTLDAIHAYPTLDCEWEETAASLDIPLDSLSIDTYMQHFFTTN